MSSLGPYTQITHLGLDRSPFLIILRMTIKKMDIYWSSISAQGVNSDLLHLQVAGRQTGRVKNNKLRRTGNRGESYRSLGEKCSPLYWHGPRHSTATCFPWKSSLLPMNLSLSTIFLPSSLFLSPSLSPSLPEPQEHWISLSLWIVF